jgi:hypothetical protein
MKTQRQSPAQPKRIAIHLGAIAASILMTAMVPATALAAPPATVATCDGIKDAYPVLGTQCQNAYANINHAPVNAGDRLTSFKARKTVLEIFRKALLCNGMYGATKQAQTTFSQGETGHLTALANLRVAMTNAGDPTIPAAYVAADLNGVAINKQQCK